MPTYCKKRTLTRWTRDWVAAQRRKGGFLGVSTKKKVSVAWSILLARNVDDKLTDERLLQKMQFEFPLRRKFQPIGRIRSFYNRGVLGYGAPNINLRDTPAESFPYDEAGNVLIHSDWGSRRRKKHRFRRKKIRLKK